MKTKIDYFNKTNINGMKKQQTLITYGASKITITKTSHVVDTITVSYELTKYILNKYQGDVEKALRHILERLTMRQIRRLLFDALAAQSVQPTALNFKTIVYNIYKERKGK